MIKRTLYFGNPARLRVKDLQLCIQREDKADKTVPVEDIGFIILDHYAVTLSQYAMMELLRNNVMVYITDETHMPAGLMMPLAGNHEQTASFRAQFAATKPLNKRLWQQTIQAKIRNQAALLDRIGVSGHPLRSIFMQVQSGDVTNQEGAAAKIYWQLLFDPVFFRRRRFGKPPNNLLNYGYAILRGVIARGLCGTGLLPMIGIHHRNRYDPFPLADDIMEPYRPFVDELVWYLARDELDITTLTPDLKQKLLDIPAMGARMGGEIKPLHLAAARTASSLKKCFMEANQKIIYPTF